jgi:predicted ATPase
VVLLVGEPGIGKSRLVATLMERLSSESYQLRYFCSPQHQDSPLFPVLGHIARQRSSDRDLAGVGRAGPSEPGQEHLLETFASQLAEVAARRPVLVLFEDVHWIE